MVACNHIATLLTRGIEHSNDNRPGRKVIAVSGRLASNPYFTVCIDADEDPALSTAILTQNPTPKDQPVFKIYTVKPSPACLKDIVTFPYVHSATRSL